jgi:hypothetical protein
MKNFLVMNYHSMKAIKEGRKTVTRRPLKKTEYTVGTVLDIKEPFARVQGVQKCEVYSFYQADGIPLPTKWLTWTSGMYIPKNLIRYKMLITEVRKEYLQEISEQSALQEGVDWIEENGVRKYRDYSVDMEEYYSLDTAVESYATLWDKLNPTKKWATNPKVEVIKFKLLE